MHMSANFKPLDFCTIGLYIFLKKKRILKVNLSPHKNLFLKKNHDLGLHLCKKKKNMQLCNTLILKRRTVQENYLFKPWKKMESESEFTDFDILKSLIGTVISAQ